MSFPQSPKKAHRALIALALVLPLALPAAASPRESRAPAQTSWRSWIAGLSRSTLSIRGLACALGFDFGSCIDPNGGQRAESLCALASERGSCTDPNGQPAVVCYGSCIDPNGNH
jgi:hypothetical protein